MQRVFGTTPIYWINLDISTERKNMMMKQLELVNHTRISAINGINKDKFKKEFEIIDENPTYSCALVAVICSHLKAIKIAFDNTLPFVIILEDKCHFDFIDKFEHTIQDIIKITTQKNTEWEIIQLSSIPLYDNLRDYKNNGLQVHKYSKNYFGLNYLINNKGMKKILNLLPTNGNTKFNLKTIKNVSNPEYGIYNNLNSYVLNIPIFYVYSEKSTFPYYFNENEPYKIDALNMQIITKQKIFDFYEQKNNNIQILPPIIKNIIPSLPLIKQANTILPIPQLVIPTNTIIKTNNTAKPALAIIKPETKQIIQPSVIPTNTIIKTNNTAKPALAIIKPETKQIIQPSLTIINPIKANNWRYNQRNINQYWFTRSNPENRQLCHNK